MVHTSLGGLVEAEHIEEGVINISIDLLLEILSFIDILKLPFFELIQSLERIPIEISHAVHNTKSE